MTERVLTHAAQIDRNNFNTRTAAGTLQCDGRYIWFGTTCTCAYHTHPGNPNNQLDAQFYENAVGSNPKFDKHAMRDGRIF